ncbi:hypothetical protein [Endozoicomonas elysicola]|uniref:hypothetical protein n=1 Tax=Endozoicomonas elysicola TaxID=305900 RepID=UPI00126963D2|nr:hypothetical protein [Endozoicomonas elysicola]
MSASDSQLGRLDQVKDQKVSSDAKTAATSHNALVTELKSLEAKVALLETKVSSFKEEFGAATKFMDKKHPGSSDFQRGKSFVIPKAGLGSERITITSPDKSTRKEQVQDLHSMLKSDPGVKARFSEHNQNKHNLKVTKELIAEKKEELYQSQKQTKSALSKAESQLYKEQKAELKATRDAAREQVKQGYESQRDVRKQGYQETKQNLRAEYDKKHDAKVKVRDLKDSKKQEIKDLNKQIKGSESRLGNLMAKAAKKLMPDAQKDAVFNESTAAKEKMSATKDPLIAKKAQLKQERKGLKAQEASLKEQQKSINDELFDQREKLKGANEFQGIMKDVFGRNMKVGRQAWGDLGKLKGKRNQGLDQIKEDYKASKADAKKAKKQNKQALKDLARGKLKESTDARQSMGMRPVFQFRGDTILQKFSDNAFKQDQEWKSDISALIQNGQTKELRLVENTLLMWTADPENSGDYTEALEFIQGQKSAVQSAQGARTDGVSPSAPDVSLVEETRGESIVQNFRQSFYSGNLENQWKADINELIDNGDFKSLDIVEDALKEWGTRDGYEDFSHVLEFISDQRKSRSP